MAFTDLPDDWLTRPLTEPRLVADVLDLLVSDADRREGGLLIALCDDEARLLQPMIIGDLPSGQVSGESTDSLAPLLSHLAGEGLMSSVLVALGRLGSLSITRDDLAWRAAVAQACSGNVRLLGMHVVTPEGSREVLAGREPRSRPAAPCGLHRRVGTSTMGW